MMKNQVFIAGYRALGLIDKIVTGPLWMAHVSHGKERKEPFQAAQKFAPTFKEKFKRRRQEIEMKRKQDMKKT